MPQCNSKSGTFTRQFDNSGNAKNAPRSGSQTSPQRATSFQTQGKLERDKTTAGGNRGRNVCEVSENKVKFSIIRTLVKMVRQMENVSNRKYSNIAISNQVFVRISQDPSNRVTLQCQQPRINEFSFAACKNISFFPSMKGSGFLLNNLKHLSEHIRNKYGFTLSSRRITIGSCLKIVSSAHQT